MEFKKSDEIITALQKSFNEELDNLLVQKNKEKPRKEHVEGYSPDGFGFLIKVRDKPRVDMKMFIYPRENEPPHFMIVYKNKTCRFFIHDCSPMKAELEKGIPREIESIRKEIKICWSKNKEQIIDVYNKTRSSDSQPQTNLNT